MAALLGVQLHKIPMHRFLHGVEREQAKGCLDGGIILVARDLRFEQFVQGSHGNLAKPGALR